MGTSCGLILNTETRKTEAVWGVNSCSGGQEISPLFMEPELSLFRSQEPATGSYPETV
jgi:hypothetical protein